MDRDLVTDYLRSKGMEAAHADALSMIFAQVATKDDLRVLEHKFDARFDALERRVDGKIDALERWVDVRIDALEEKIDVKLGAMEDRFDKKLGAMQTRMTWGMITLITLLAVLITLMGRLV